MRNLLLGLLVLSAALAGCTSQDEFVTPDQDDEGRYVVHMTSSNRFEPSHIDVPVGATVVWVADSPGHNVIADDGSFRSTDETESSTLQQGEEYAHTFTAAGEHAYFCQPHKALGMTGVVRVVDA